MASKNPLISRASAAVGTIARDSPGSPALDEARRNLRVEVMAAYIERKLAEFPPLREDQLDRIATLLRPTMDRLAAEADAQVSA